MPTRPLMGNRSSTKESEASAAAASRAPDGALGTCKSILIGHTQNAGKPELIADLKRLRDTALGFMDGFQSSVNIQTIGIDYVRFPTPLPIDPRGAHLEYQCHDVSGQERFRGSAQQSAKIDGSARLASAGFVRLENLSSRDRTWAPCRRGI